jgi:hypothetical protein
MTAHSRAHGEGGGIAILINDCECGFKYGGADDTALCELVGANQPERSMVGVLWIKCGARLGIAQEAEKPLALEGQPRNRSHRDAQVACEVA